MAEAVQRALTLLREPGQHHVVTPNSEMLVESTRNPRFHEVLRNAALAIPDSAGLLWAARKTHQHLQERVAGVDFVQTLSTQLSETDTVFLLGGGEGVAEEAAAALQARNPSLSIVGTYAGSPKEEDAAHILQRINAASPRVLFVAYGAPKQDIWIADHLAHMPTVRVAIGVGGTFDFLAGRVKRAPTLLRNMHLEWAWRLLLQPWRWKRIWTAVVTFPLLIVRSKKSD